MKRDKCKIHKYHMREDDGCEGGRKYFEENCCQIIQGMMACV